MSQYECGFCGKLAINGAVLHRTEKYGWELDHRPYGPAADDQCRACRSCTRDKIG